MFPILNTQGAKFILFGNITFGGVSGLIPSHNQNLILDELGCFKRIRFLNFLYHCFFNPGICRNPQGISVGACQFPN